MATTIYKGQGWGKTVVGEIDTYGTVYSGTGLWKSQIGVCSGGVIYRGIGCFKEEMIGSYKDGVVYSGSGTGYWTRNQVGSYDYSGDIYSEVGFGRELIGCCDGGDVGAAAAALLLLSDELAGTSEPVVHKDSVVDATSSYHTSTVESENSSNNKDISSWGMTDAIFEAYVRNSLFNVLRDKRSCFKKTLTYYLAAVYTFIIFWQLSVSSVIAFFLPYNMTKKDVMLMYFLRFFTAIFAGLITAGAVQEEDKKEYTSIGEKARFIGKSIVFIPVSFLRYYEIRWLMLIGLVVLYFIYFILSNWLGFELAFFNEIWRIAFEEGYVIIY